MTHALQVRLALWLKCEGAEGCHLSRLHDVEGLLGKLQYCEWKLARTKRGVAGRVQCQWFLLSTRYL